MTSKRIPIILGFLLLIFFVFFSSRANETNRTTPDARIMSGTGKRELLSPSGHIMNVEIADTSERRTLGLGGRDTIGDDEGMLFVFPKSDFYGFWMKDMRFPLDIVWLDEDFKVVYVKENVSPNTYPEIFFPQTKAVYVLEMKGNRAENSGVVLGSVLLLK